MRVGGGRRRGVFVNGWAAVPCPAVAMRGSCPRVDGRRSFVQLSLIPHEWSLSMDGRCPWMDGRRSFVQLSLIPHGWSLSMDGRYSWVDGRRPFVQLSLIPHGWYVIHGWMGSGYMSRCH